VLPFYLRLVKGLVLTQIKEIGEEKRREGKVRVKEMEEEKKDKRESER